VHTIEQLKTADSRDEASISRAMRPNAFIGGTFPQVS
jgi:hypothetical protein